MRFAVDTGGTFTDLIVEDDDGGLHMFKASTTPDDPIRGVMDSLGVAAEAFGEPLEALLGKASLFIHGTTHAINAIITGTTAKTAFLTSKGHRDILVFREGGRSEPFNFTRPFPEPYIARALTFEVPGRTLADGAEFEPFEPQAVRAIAEELREAEIEAVAVCLLWSIVNPDHELKVGEILEQCLPGVPFTLSHQLNPSLREYRRASSAAIDASLKPKMQSYLHGLTGRLTDAGFAGRVLIVTSQGGVMDADQVADAPIHLVNSGPSMAPIAGRHFARTDEGFDNAVIADTGGTTYDVSLVRSGRIPWTRETWIGEPHRGHMTGFPSVDVKSIGSGGGSIAHVDAGGMLHVGPQSAGAVPGPACYGQGGNTPTVTDAALVLGYLDPDYFLGGAMKIDVAAAKDALARDVAGPLRLGIEQAAAAVINVATEDMVQAITDITVNQGIDPASAVLIGGGGAAGLNQVAIARRLGSQRVVIPHVGAALSAAGALMSDLAAQYRRAFVASSARFDFDGVNAVLAGLRAECQAFADGPGAGALEQRIEFFAEARYPDQVWEIEVPLAGDRFAGDVDVAELVEAFHMAHEEVFAIRDAGSDIEIMAWVANVRCRLREDAGSAPEAPSGDGASLPAREVHFAGHGKALTEIRNLDSIAIGETIQGPAIIESPFSAIVVDPGASATRRPSGSISIDPGRAPAGGQRP